MLLDSQFWKKLQGVTMSRDRMDPPVPSSTMPPEP